MEEKNERKLHLLVETAIMALIILCCNLVLSYGIQFLAGGNFEKYTEMVSATRQLGQLFPVVAAVLCVNGIEKRKINVVKLIIISLCVSMFFSYIITIITLFIAARFGEEALASFSAAKTFVSPVLLGFFVAIFINILCAPKAEVQIFDEKMYYGLFKHVLLLLVTGGIWILVWNYRVTRYLNCVEGEEYRNPGNKLLLCMLVPFYSIYWTYKSAQRIDKLAESVGVRSDITMPCLILEIFVPIIPPVLMQDKTNKIQEAAKV